MNECFPYHPCGKFDLWRSREPGYFFATTKSSSGNLLPDNWAKKPGETLTCERCEEVFVAESYPQVWVGQQSAGVHFRRETRRERRRRLKGKT